MPVARVSGFTRIKGAVYALSFDGRLVKDFDDYVAIVGRNVPMTRALATELERERAVLSWTKTHNIVVNTGLTRLAYLAIGGSTAAFIASGVGSGSTTPQLGDTDMTAPIQPRLAVSYAYVSGQTAFWDTSFPPGSNVGTWHEAGLYDQVSTGGTMGAHALFPSPQTKGNNTIISEWSWGFQG